MNNWKSLYLISFLEGASLMAIELLSSKMIAPYFGTSIYVWTSVFTTTLGGIALGYYLGGRMSLRENISKKLNYILLFGALYTACIYPLSIWVMDAAMGMFDSIQLGSLVSCMIFIFPLLTSFGMVSPIQIRMLTQTSEEVGSKAGNIYTVSTLGGILLTILMGFYIIPYLGVKMGLIITALMMASAFLLNMVNRKANFV